MSPHPPAGIYVHWPFCARKCPYCDFYTFGAEHPNFSASDPYLEVLLKEIHSLPDRLRLDRKPVADTVYFGGGTPSLMEPRQLGRILEALRSVFAIAPGAEITLEVNPTAAEAVRLGPARDLGVNRLSVGCQSFDDRLLRLLGRDHDAAMARRVLSEIPQLGYDNYSIDLMFSLPGQTLDDLRADLDTALGFSPSHVSAYGLTLHDGTPFKRWNEEGRWRLPESDAQAAQFELLMDHLASKGWEHYEISNWSRPGMRSRHNSKYWSAADIFAFGVSAHGVLSGRRHANPRDFQAYLEAASEVGGPWGAPEPAPPELRARLGEIMMVAIRRVEGVAWTELNAWVAAWHPEDGPRDLREYYRAEIARLSDEGLIANEREACRDTTLRLTRRGVMFADDIALRFF